MGPQIEGQTTQWQSKNGKRTKTIYKTMHRKQNNRIPLKIGDGYSSCSTSGTRRVASVTNPVISHESGKDQEELTTSGPHPLSFVTYILRNG